LREVRDLASRGFKEVTLLGQNVNSYRSKGGTTFAALLRDVDSIRGIGRIRFMTSHPKDAGASLFKAMAGLGKVCEHLHLPLQSGSDRILKRMNRGYTSGHYRRLVDLYRKTVDGGSITTDVIVGFPGETEADFRRTRSLMEDAGFDGVYTFKYSPRPPAKAAMLADSVPEAVKTRRLLELVELQCRASERRNRAEAGKTLEVLVDGFSRKDPSELAGRTRTGKVAVFKGPKGLVGKFVDVRISSVTPYALKGRMTG
jgi:tRNA-2-methylthio-N6-dimethylallyladenosine synthase